MTTNSVILDCFLFAGMVFSSFDFPQLILDGRESSHSLSRTIGGSGQSLSSREIIFTHAAVVDNKRKQARARGGQWPPVDKLH